MSKRILPEHFNSTMREWKQLKRSQLKAAIQTVEDFRFGSAYTPAYHYMDPLDDMTGGSHNWC